MKKLLKCLPLLIAATVMFTGCPKEAGGDQGLSYNPKPIFNANELTETTQDEIPFEDGKWSLQWIKENDYELEEIYDEFTISDFSTSSPKLTYTIMKNTILGQISKDKTKEQVIEYYKDYDVIIKGNKYFVSLDSREDGLPSSYENPSMNWNGFSFQYSQVNSLLKNGYYFKTNKERTKFYIEFNDNNYKTRYYLKNENLCYTPTPLFDVSELTETVADGIIPFENGDWTLQWIESIENKPDKDVILDDVVDDFTLSDLDIKDNL